MKKEEKVLMSAEKKALQRILSKSSALRTLKRQVGGVAIVTFRPERLTTDIDFLKDCLFVFDFVQKSRGVHYGYPFLAEEAKLKKFFEQGGLLTISHEELAPLGFNMSKFEPFDADSDLLVAGITVIGKHSTGIPVFKYSNLNYTLFTSAISKEMGRKCRVATLINDGLSLEYFINLTGETCYPYDKFPVSREGKKTAEKVASRAFDAYVKDNFPESGICLNTHIVVSRKKDIGFNDSFWTVAHGSDLGCSTFIRCWLSDFETEDILFTGIIDDKALGKLKEGKQ